jgi:hypothetical protein
MLRNERGSGFLKILIYLVLISYIGLLIFRFVSISIRYKDVDVKIRDAIRNSIECNRDKLMEQIYNLLDERGIVPVEEEISVQCKGNKARVSFSYEEILDGIFFKKKILKRVEVEGVIS